MVGWLMYDELEMIWKEVILACFKIPSSRSPGGTGVNRESSQSE
jgi:hypothetical protein